MKQGSKEMKISRNTPSVQSKLAKTGTTIFTIMSNLAKEHNAINLSQGYPDFSCATELISLVNKHMKKGYNQYAPMPGVLALREQIAAKSEKLYGLYPNPETDVTITAGATQAIYTAITALIREKDEIIIFNPAYDSYLPAVELNHGEPVFVQLKTPDYRIPWEEVKKIINNRTRMIILNTPHNPTGTTLSEDDMKQLQRIVKGTDILLLGDEVYEHILFDGAKHQSLLRYPDLYQRSIIVGSFGKTYHITGWKIGYCIAPAYLTKEFRKVHQFTVFSVNTPMQHALAEYLKEETAYLSLSDFYQEKRDYFLKLLEGSCFSWQPANGSYFQILNYSQISDEKDTDFAIRLTKELGVASIPVSVFYNNGLDAKVLRFCFAKKDETLEKAAELLRKL